MRHIVSNLVSVILIGAALGAAIVGIAGLRGSLSRKPPIEIFADMNRQLKLRPQELNSFFQNGVSSQLPPPGTISRSDPVQTVSGLVYPFEDSPVNTGHDAGVTNFVETNPLPVNSELLRLGRARFDIYCAPCHGKLGDGNGITKKIGVMPAVANLHDQRIVEMTDGEIFNTVSHGKGLMSAYAPLMSAPDRWAAIAYLRALQLSWLGATNDLPADKQAALK
jgi:hypothetical protein